MTKNKFMRKLYAGAVLLCSLLTATSCEKGLTFEEAPESTYSLVDISGFTVRARELFTDKIYAVNWEQWVENYIDTRQIGYTGGTSWTNNTGSAYTLPDGTRIEPGATATIPGSVTPEPDSSCPGGEVYVINVYALSRVQYQTANKGYQFVGEKFSGDYELVNPTDGMSQYVILPVRQNEVIGEMTLIDYSVCEVEPVDGAPALGKPGDFTAPRRYLVKNTAYRPAGVDQYKRMYEVRVTFLP